MCFTDRQSLQKKRKKEKKSGASTYALGDDLEDVGSVLSALQRATSTIVNLIMLMLAMIKFRVVHFLPASSVESSGALFVAGSLLGNLLMALLQPGLKL